MVIKVEDWKTEADALEYTDLVERQAYYTQLMEAKAAEHRRLAIAEVKELMAKHNVSAEDLAEIRAETSRKAAGSGRKMPPKYRDLSDPANVWTGQGKAPKWMPENKEQWPDFLIPPEKPAEEAPQESNENELRLDVELTPDSPNATDENAEAAATDQPSENAEETVIDEPAEPAKRKSGSKRKTQPE